MPGSIQVVMHTEGPDAISKVLRVYFGSGSVTSQPYEKDLQVRKVRLGKTK